MKVFRNREEVRQALLDVNSLDHREHPKVYKKMVKELDHGGVSRQEFREVVQELKSDYDISDIDARNLLSLLK